MGDRGSAPKNGGIRPEVRGRMRHGRGDSGASGETGAGRPLGGDPLRFTEEAVPEELRRQGYSSVAVFTIPVGLNDIILLE